MEPIQKQMPPYDGFSIVAKSTRRPNRLEVPNVRKLPSRQTPVLPATTIAGHRGSTRLKPWLIKRGLSPLEGGNACRFGDADPVRVCHMEKRPRGSPGAERRGLAGARRVLLVLPQRGFRAGGGASFRAGAPGSVHDPMNVSTECGGFVDRLRIQPSQDIGGEIRA